MEPEKEKRSETETIGMNSEDKEWAQGPVINCSPLTTTSSDRTAKGES